MQKNRDRLALLLGLILILIAAACIVTVAVSSWHIGHEGTVKILNVTVNWSSIHLMLVAAGLLIAPAGFLLAVLRWQKGLIAINVELMIILCAVLLGIVSYVNNRYYRREDWTKKGRYGLSDQTITLLKEDVKKNLTITMLLVTDNPDLYRHLMQILKEYKSHCGNVELVTYNPDVDLEKVTELLKQLDIKTMPAMIIEYGDRHEEITPGSLLEYPRNPYGAPSSPKFKVEEEVTSAIMKLVDEKPIELCFVTGHGERDPEDYSDEGLSEIRKQLEKANYKIKKIDVAKDPIPEDCVLVIAGPRKAKFQEVELEAIREFLASDLGRALVLADPKSESGVDTGLGGLFADYDVTLRDDVTVVNMTLDFRTMRPALTLITRAFCDETAGAGNDIVSKMQGYAFVLPQACAIETKPSDPGGPPNAGCRATPILRAAESIKVEGKKTATVWGETNLKQGEALEYNADKGDIGPPVTVGVAVAPAPPPPPRPGMPPPPQDDLPTGPRIVLIGDSDFAMNRWVKDRPPNANLFTNCAAWLAAKKGKLGIPPKDIELERLDRDRVEGSKRWLAILLFAVVCPTMAGVVLGGFVWVLRRK